MYPVSGLVELDARSLLSRNGPDAQALGVVRELAHRLPELPVPRKALKAHRLLYHSAPGSRVMKKKKKTP